MLPCVLWPPDNRTRRIILQTPEHMESIRGIGATNELSFQWCPIDGRRSPLCPNTHLNPNIRTLSSCTLLLFPLRTGNGFGDYTTTQVPTSASTPCRQGLKLPRQTKHAANPPCYRPAFPRHLPCRHLRHPRHLPRRCWPQSPLAARYRRTYSVMLHASFTFKTMDGTQLFYFDRRFVCPWLTHASNGPLILRSVRSKWVALHRAHRGMRQGRRVGCRGSLF